MPDGRDRPSLLPEKKESDLLTGSIFHVANALALAMSAGAAQPPLPPNNDPNQLVCVTESESGSRLRRHRICRTREEWEQHRRELRTSLQRAQNQTQTQCVPTPTMQC